MADLAALLGVTEAEVANEISEMEKERVICGYHTLINWDKTNNEKVTALIEVKVTPQRGLGLIQLPREYIITAKCTHFTLCPEDLTLR